MPVSRHKTARSTHETARSTHNQESVAARQLTCDRPTRDPVSPDPESLQESYFGGKGGCFRNLINQIPPHDTLYVPFAGHCAIVRNIRRPKRVFLNDLDAAVVAWWRRQLDVSTRKSESLPATTPNSESEYSGSQITITRRCGIECLDELGRDARREAAAAGVSGAFVYLDPPYLQSTRKSESRYRHEMTHDDHVRLLDVAKSLPCRVMISGYSSKLYAKQLADWRHFDFPSMTRGGKAIEHVWCNYPEPTELQDYRWLGRDRRERFKLLRRERNMIQKLSRLTAIERNALLTAVDSHFGVSGSR